jgi:hypothetical protein
MKNFKILYAVGQCLTRMIKALDAFLNPCAPPPDSFGQTAAKFSFHEKLFLS